MLDTVKNEKARVYRNGAFVNSFSIKPEDNTYINVDCEDLLASSGLRLNERNQDETLPHS